MKGAIRGPKSPATLFRASLGRRNTGEEEALADVDYESKKWSEKFLGMDGLIPRAGRWSTVPYTLSRCCNCVRFYNFGGRSAVSWEAGADAGRDHIRTSVISWRADGGMGVLLRPGRDHRGRHHRGAVVDEESGGGDPEMQVKKGRVDCDIGGNRVVHSVSTTNGRDRSDPIPGESGVRGGVAGGDAARPA